MVGRSTFGTAPNVHPVIEIQLLYSNPIAMTDDWIFHLFSML
jgi:hypothetical protein